MRKMSHQSLPSSLRSQRSQKTFRSERLSWELSPLMETAVSTILSVTPSRREEGMDFLRLINQQVLYQFKESLIGRQRSSKARDPQHTHLRLKPRRSRQTFILHLLLQPKSPSSCKMLMTRGRDSSVHNWWAKSMRMLWLTWVSSSSGRTTFLKFTIWIRGPTVPSLFPWKESLLTSLRSRRRKESMKPTSWSNWRRQDRLITTW